MKQNADQILKCPACDESQEEVAINYTITGRTGSGSSALTACVECFEFFGVTNNGDGTVQVGPGDPDEQ